MRQFILANGYTTTAEVGKLSLDDKNITLYRANASGGNILYPFNKTDLTIIKSTTAANAVALSKTLTLTEVSEGLDYGLMFIKKGKGFNERNTWTFTIRAKGSDTAETIAAAIKAWCTANKETLGITAAIDSTTKSKLTFTGPATGEDFEIKGCDEYTGLKATGTSGKAAFMDAAMIADLANKCAADAGFEYTNEPDGIYPGYPATVASGLYTVFTLRFTEPRVVGTREESIYQIIQIAVPSASASGVQTELAKLTTIKTA